jgi:hypothetical protein
MTRGAERSSRVAKDLPIAVGNSPSILRSGAWQVGEKWVLRSRQGLTDGAVGSNRMGSGQINPLIVDWPGWSAVGGPILRDAYGGSEECSSCPDAACAVVIPGNVLPPRLREARGGGRRTDSAGEVSASVVHGARGRVGAGKGLARPGVAQSIADFRDRQPTLRG